MQVEVIHARPTDVWRQKLELPAGATLGDALDASGLLRQFPELIEAPCGVFGRVCTREHVLAHGDRVEVYRPLVFDPMESRRRRARHRARTASPEITGGALSRT